MKKVTLVRGVACIQGAKQNLFLSLTYKSYHVRTSFRGSETPRNFITVQSPVSFAKTAYVIYELCNKPEASCVREDMS
jgi:hypothetical protein